MVLYSVTPGGKMTILPDLMSSGLLAEVNSTQLTICVICGQEVTRISNTIYNCGQV